MMRFSPMSLKKSKFLKNHQKYFKWKFLAETLLYSKRLNQNNIICLSKLKNLTPLKSIEARRGAKEGL